MTDELYAACRECPWHAPTTFASVLEDELLCPECGHAVETMLPERFWAKVRAADKQQPGYEAMMRWSEGKRFADFDTLEGAWRQYSEGRV